MRVLYSTKVKRKLETIQKKCNTESAIVGKLNFHPLVSKFNGDKNEASVLKSVDGNVLSN